MSNPYKPAHHLLKAVTNSGTSVALCGRSVHNHVCSKDAVLVTCINCLKQLRKISNV